MIPFAKLHRAALRPGPKAAGIFLYLGLLAAGLPSAATPPAERLLPADTLGFVTVPDWPTAQSNFNQSGFGQFLSDPEMKAFNEAFFANLTTNTLAPLEKELGIKVKDYFDLLRGQVTVAAVRNGWNGQSGTRPGYVWLIDTREKSDQLRTNLTELRRKWVSEGKRIRTTKMRDVEFSTLTIPRPDRGASPAAGEQEPKAASAAPLELSIGQSGSVLVITDALKDVERILALQSDSSVPALADQASFAAHAHLLRGSSLFGWIDVKAIMDTLAKKRSEQPEEPPSLFGPALTWDRILGALGLSGVQTVGLNVQNTREGSLLNVAVNVPEAARKGVFRILSVDTKDAAPPPFVPADAVKFSRWRIDLQKAWLAVEAMLLEISPASSGAIRLLLDTAGKDKDINFDLRKVLLANLGDDWISYEKSGRGVTSPLDRPSVTLIGAKNADQLASSIKTLASIIPPNLAKYSEREFLGRTIYSFTLPAMTIDTRARPFTYAASGGYVAFSSDPALIEEYLRSNEGKNRPLIETAGLNEAAQKVGGMGTGYFSCENQKEAMRATFEAAGKDPQVLLSALGAERLGILSGPPGLEVNPVAQWFDPKLMPPFERVAKYFDLSVSAVNVSPNAITFRAFTPTPHALRK